MGGGGGLVRGRGEGALVRGRGEEALVRGRGEGALVRGQGEGAFSGSAFLRFLYDSWGQETLLNPVISIGSASLERNAVNQCNGNTPYSLLL